MRKKAQVIMLPTEDNIPSKYLISEGKLYESTFFFKGITSKNPDVNYQHLYIVSDNDKIKEGDWFIVTTNNLNEIHQKGENDKSGIRFDNNNPWARDCKKIIATTDKSLEIVQPHQDFIEYFIKEYNKGNIITDVLVEYDKIATWCNDGKVCTCNVPKFCKEGRNGWEYKLKINSQDNTITIHYLKESWSKEELKQIALDNPNDSDLGALIRKLIL